jgi:hypothetical protein
MIDTLVAFGCSNTFGSDSLGTGNNSPESIYHAYPYFLSQKLNIPNYKSHAFIGASNIYIGMKVAEFLINNPELHKSTFVVIGWTGDNRLPIRKPCGKIVSATYNQRSSSNNPIREILDKLHTKVFFNGDFTRKLLFSHYIEKYGKDKEGNFLIFLLRDLLAHFFYNTQPLIFLNAIIKYGIVQLLQSYNVAYITLPTILYHPHPLYNLIPQKNNISSYDNEENVIFDMKKKFNEYRHPKAGHISRAGHMKLAEYMYEYIQKQDIIP